MSNWRNSSNGHATIHGHVNAVEETIPIVRPIVVALVLSALILLLFVGFYISSLCAKKKAVRARPGFLDLEESVLKNEYDTRTRSPQFAFVKSPCGAFLRRSMSVVDKDCGNDHTSTRIHISYLIGSPQDITPPPPAYTSRTHSLIFRERPTISFINPRSPTSSRQTRRTFFSTLTQKARSPLIISKPILQGEGSLLRGRIEREAVKSPLLFFQTRPTKIAPPVISKPIMRPEGPLPGPRMEHEDFASVPTFLCPSAAPRSDFDPHGLPVAIYLQQPSQTHRSTCPIPESDESLTSSKIGLAF